MSTSSPCIKQQSTQRKGTAFRLAGTAGEATTRLHGGKGKAKTAGLRACRLAVARTRPSTSSCSSNSSAAVGRGSSASAYDCIIRRYACSRLASRLLSAALFPAADIDIQLLVLHTAKRQRAQSKETPLLHAQSPSNKAPCITLLGKRSGEGLGARSSTREKTRTQRCRHGVPPHAEPCGSRLSRTTATTAQLAVAASAWWPSGQVDGRSAAAARFAGQQLRRCLTDSH